MIRSPKPALPEAARKESIIGLETMVVGCEELALDRDVCAGVAVRGDQVDAGVVLALRAPGHSLQSQTSVNWSAKTGSIAQVGLHQPLELGALVASRTMAEARSWSRTS